MGCSPTAEEAPCLCTSCNRIWPPFSTQLGWSRPEGSRALPFTIHTPPVNPHIWCACSVWVSTPLLIQWSGLASMSPPMFKLHVQQPPNPDTRGGCLQNDGSIIDRQNFAVSPDPSARYFSHSFVSRIYSSVRRWRRPPPRAAPPHGTHSTTQCTSCASLRRGSTPEKSMYC